MDPSAERSEPVVPDSRPEGHDFARKPRADAKGAPRIASTRGEQDSRAHLVAAALLSASFAVYVTVVLTSSLGLKPLGTRSAAFSALAFGLLSAALFTHWRWSARLATGSISARARNEARTPTALSRVALSVAWAGAAVTLASFVLAVLLPIGAYDALGYRLPAVVQWLEAGALVWVRGDDPLRNGYPLALEVLEAVGYRAFGRPRFVDATAHLFLLAGAASLAGYGRRLGLSRPLSAFVAGLFLLVPMHVLNAPSGYADAAFAGGLLVFFVALARWVEAARPELGLLAELGIASTFAIALKPHGFLFVGLSMACGLALRGSGVGLRRAVREVGTVFALSIPGLFFAVRNVLLTGNPIYPLELRVGTHVLLRGKASLDAILTPDYNVPAALRELPAWLRPFWVWLQPQGPAQTFDDRLAGFGYAFMLGGLPALTWLCWRTYRDVFARARKTARFDRGPQHGLSLLLGLTWLCWLLQPFSFWSRFTSWLWGAAALALALAIHALVESGRGRSALALASCTLLLALPEALYALVHVKHIDRFGTALLEGDALSQLTRIAGIEPDFVRQQLVGKAHVCRTPWRIGTDDANLDGVVAQLTPRPRMHVIEKAALATQLANTRARGCDQLIVIGDNPLLARLPASLATRVVKTTAFGEVHLLPVLPAEVLP